MTIRLFHAFKTIAKQLIMVVVAVALLFSFTPTAVLAKSSATATEPPTGPIVVPGVTEPVAGKNIEELKQQRSEWQSRASSSRDREDDEPKSLGETLTEKLNLDEITEGYHPEREAQKARTTTP